MRNKLTEKELKNITNQFYSNFCGINLSEAKQGVQFVCTKDRDTEVKGFGCKYAIFILVKDDTCVVSYSPKYADIIHEVKACGMDEVLTKLQSAFKLKKMQLMIFEKEKVKDYGNAKILKASDYPLYEAFFRKTSPKANPEGWLYEYFIEKTSKEYFAGYILNDTLVSVCDAPDMPYMEDIIQHTGIQTLQNERRKGYAKRTVALATHHLIENGVCPQWECSADNFASIALAQSIGYEKYGMAYILEE